jgi:FkbM family methyltransferase
MRTPVSELVRSLGLVQGGLTALQDARWLYRFTWPKGQYRLFSKVTPFPLWCRSHSSDRAVFEQIFVEREYSPLDRLSTVRTIVDCGGYVGYSTAYLLSKFPEANAIVIEPDPANFSLLQRNLAHYSHRVIWLNAALWSHDTQLGFVELPFRSGRECTRQVCEIPDGPIRAISMETIMRLAGFSSVDLLKIDVEGAECEIFSKPTPWLERVRSIAIELHDDSHFGEASPLFINACGSEFSLMSNGELTFAFRRDA